MGHVNGILQAVCGIILLFITIQLRGQQTDILNGAVKGVVDSVKKKTSNPPSSAKTASETRNSSNAKDLLIGIGKGMGSKNITASNNTPNQGNGQSVNQNIPGENTSRTQLTNNNVGTQNSLNGINNSVSKNEQPLNSKQSATINKSSGESVNKDIQSEINNTISSNNPSPIISESTKNNKSAESIGENNSKDKQPVNSENKSLLEQINNEIKDNNRTSGGTAPSGIKHGTADNRNQAGLDEKDTGGKKIDQEEAVSGSGSIAEREKEAMQRMRNGIMDIMSSGKETGSGKEEAENKQTKPKSDNRKITSLASIIKVDSYKDLIVAYRYYHEQLYDYLISMVESIKGRVTDKRLSTAFEVDKLTIAGDVVDAYSEIVSVGYEQNNGNGFPIGAGFVAKVILMPINVYKNYLDNENANRVIGGTNSLLDFFIALEDGLSQRKPMTDKDIDGILSVQMKELLKSESDEMKLMQQIYDTYQIAIGKLNEPQTKALAELKIFRLLMKHLQSNGRCHLVIDRNLAIRGNQTMGDLCALTGPIHFSKYENTSHISQEGAYTTYSPEFLQLLMSEINKTMGKCRASHISVNLLDVADKIDIQIKLYLEGSYSFSGKIATVKRADNPSGYQIALSNKAGKECVTLNGNISGTPMQFQFTADATDYGNWTKTCKLLFTDFFRKEARNALSLSLGKNFGTMKNISNN